MKLKNIIEIVNAELLWGKDLLVLDIKRVSCSDLLSDVLAFTKPDTLLVTGLVNLQVIRTAEMSDISAVCFVRGKKPNEDVISLAREKNIPVFATALSMYETSGRLYAHKLADAKKTE